MDIEAAYGGKFIDHNTVELHVHGESVFGRLFEVLRAARHSIYLQFYIYRADSTGRELAEILKARARAGVKVFLLYDHLGSFQTPRAFWDELRAAGVETRASRPFLWGTAMVYFRRDHRKLVVIDGRTVFTGGFNIGDEYHRGLKSIPIGSWRDTGLFIHGTAAISMGRTFMDAWRRSGGLAGRVTEQSPAQPDGPHPVLPIFAHSVKGRRRMRKLLYHSIRQAVKDIWLTTAYFTPSLWMMHELELAIRRGVCVRLLVPGHSDVPAAHYAGRPFFTHLLKLGVEIYEYQGTMLHAKSYIFDDRWCVVGSANLDFRSLRWNDEGNVGIYGEGFCAEMRAIFEEDLNSAKRLDIESWRARPLIDKLKETFYTIFRRSL